MFHNVARREETLLLIVTQAFRFDFAWKYRGLISLLQLFIALVFHLWVRFEDRFVNFMYVRMKNVFEKINNRINDSLYNFWINDKLLYIKGPILKYYETVQILSWILLIFWLLKLMFLRTLILEIRSFLSIWIIWIIYKFR